MFLTDATHRQWGRAMRDEAGMIPQLPKPERLLRGPVSKLAISRSSRLRFHDAADPVGFTFRTEGEIGFSRSGLYASHCARSSARCDILVIESNRDLEGFSWVLPVVGETTRNEPGGSPLE